MSGEEPISYLWIIVFGVLFLLLGLVFLFNIFSLFKIYDNVAFLNTQKLVGGIEDACLNNRDVSNPVVLDRFELQQSTGLMLLGAKTPFVPGFLIHNSGDPNYVIYYEMFPPGEGIGWEVYYDKFGYRTDAMVEKGDSFRADLLPTMINEIKNKIVASYPTESTDVMISNIVLSDNIVDGKVLDEDAQKEKVGTWKNEIFTIQKFPMTDFQKTSIKYSACGEHSICLKTKNSVYKYPLKYCDSIDYIQLVTKQADWRARYSDFYAASPCMSKGKVRIYKANCKDPIAGIPSTHGCQKFITYPIYDYEKQTGNMKRVGYHTTCLDYDGGNLNDASAGDLDCVRVEFEDKDNFCYTYNPKGVGGWLDWNINGEPVTKTTDYVRDTINADGTVNLIGFVLKPPSLVQDGKLLWVVNQKTWFWAWPS